MTEQRPKMREFGELHAKNPDSGRFADGIETAMYGNAGIITDIFEILEVDPDGKKFDKVSR